MVETILVEHDGLGRPSARVHWGVGLDWAVSNPYPLPTCSRRPLQGAIRQSLAGPTKRGQTLTGRWSHLRLGAGVTMVRRRRAARPKKHAACQKPEGRAGIRRTN